MHRLFVYGTLAPGRPNEHILHGVPGTWHDATVRGELVDQGWGSALGFPVIVLDERGPVVHGQVFTSEELDEHWPRLDDFEGDGYERVLTTATLAGGQTVRAHVYVFRKPSPP